MDNNNQEKTVKEMFDDSISQEVLSQADNIQIPESGNNPYLIKYRRSEYITKDLIVLVVGCIAICSLFVLAKPEIIITACVSGLLGMAVGPGQK